MFEVDREAITDGPVGRVLLLLAAPLVAQNLVYVANALVDTFWLGRVSEDAVAAVGLSLPIQSFLGAVVVGDVVPRSALVHGRSGEHLVVQVVVPTSLERAGDRLAPLGTGED
jgi:hypothetical protein